MISFETDVTGLLSCLVTLKFQVLSVELYNINNFTDSASSGVLTCIVRVIRTHFFKS
jgi:hypothetical protein